MSLALQDRSRQYRRQPSGLVLCLLQGDDVLELMDLAAPGLAVRMSLGISPAAATCLSKPLGRHAVADEAGIDGTRWYRRHSVCV